MTRQTGRTTNMLQNAVNCAMETRQDVLIIVANYKELARIKEQFCKMFFDRISSVDNRSVRIAYRGDNIVIQFATMSAVCFVIDTPYYFVDHFVYEGGLRTWLREGDSNLNDWSFDEDTLP